MEYDITKIRALCDRYFEGETSTEEEKLLKTWFACNDVPADLMSVKLMLCGFEKAEHLRYQPVHNRRTSRTIFRRIIWGTSAVAAAAAICFGIFNRDIYGYDADGKAITDAQTALESTIYLTYLDKLETTIDIAQMLTSELENNN